MGAKYKINYGHVFITILMVVFIVLMVYTPYYYSTTIVPLAKEQQQAQNDINAVGNTDNVTQMNKDINNAIVLLNNVCNAKSSWFNGYSGYIKQLQLELTYTNATHKQLNVLQTYQSFINNDGVSFVYASYYGLWFLEYFVFGITLFIFALFVNDDRWSWFGYKRGW